MTQASSVAGRSARWRVLINTAIVMGGTLLSRVLGLLRDMIFSRQFGTSPEFGAFSATFSILDILYLVIIGGALGSALIPVFTRLIQHGDQERAWQLADTVLTLAFAAFAVIATIVAIFARPILSLTVASGYAPELLDLATHLLRLMLLQPLLLGIGGLLMAILQSFDRFTLPSIAFNVYNLSVIVAAWLFAPRYGIDALAYGVVAGALLYLLVMLPGVIRAGLRFRPSFDWRMPEVRRIGSLLAPRLVGQAALQINLIVMVAIFGLLNAEAQAANRYAFQLLMLPHGILAISVGTVMFPRLSRLFAAGDLPELRHTALQTLRLVLWLTIPVVVILAVLHVPILRLLYQGGAFTTESLSLTARVLLFYTPGAIGLAGAEIVIRTFYAMEDTRTPVVVGVATIVLNATLAWTLVKLRPDPGLVALSYSLTNMIEFLVLGAILLWRLRRPGESSSAEWGRSLLALALGTAALFGALVALVVVSRDRVPGVTFASPYQQGVDTIALALWLVFAALIGFALYAGIGAVLRAPELREVLALVRRRRAGEPR